MQPRFEGLDPSLERDQWDNVTGILNPVDPPPSPDGVWLGRRRRVPVSVSCYVMLVGEINWGSREKMRKRTSAKIEVGESELFHFDIFFDADWSSVWFTSFGRNYKPTSDGIPEGTAKEMVGHPIPENGNDGGLQLLTKTGHRKVGSGWVLPRLHRPSLPMLDLRLNNVEQTEGKTREVAGVMYLSKL